MLSQSIQKWIRERVDMELERIFDISNIQRHFKSSFMGKKSHLEKLSERESMIQEEIC